MTEPKFRHSTWPRFMSSQAHTSRISRFNQNPVSKPDQCVCHFRIASTIAITMIGFCGLAPFYVVALVLEMIGDCFSRNRSDFTFSTRYLDNIHDNTFTPIIENRYLDSFKLAKNYQSKIHNHNIVIMIMKAYPIIYEIMLVFCFMIIAQTV